MENPSEQAGYLEVAGDHLYTVLHTVPDPIARVLLVGPFASERHFSYIPWVRWARFLAARRIETLRFDYRGVGESTGFFEEMTFAAWNEDARFLAGWLESQPRKVPLILHGLELGGLLAKKTFGSGAGSALLLWSAPSNANEILRNGLLHRITVDHAIKKERSSMTDYVRQLEAGGAVEVDGYQYSAKLWSESFEFETSGCDDAATKEKMGRPVRSVTLDRSAAPLVKGSSLGYIVSLNPDLSKLFADNFDWIVAALAGAKGESK